MEELINSATSETNTTEDWSSFIQICETADESESMARQVVQLVSKRLLSKNVNVILFTTTLANSLLQNCGPGVKKELSSKVFVDALMKQLANKSVHGTAKFRILDLIQQWAEQYKDDPDLSFLVESYQILKNQNYQFPSIHKPEESKTKSSLQKDKEIEEDEELQLALALSLTDVNDKSNREFKASKNHYSVSQPKAGPKVLFQVKALYDFPGHEEGELGLHTGSVIDVYDSTTFHEWWKGGFSGKVGIFPSNYVEKLTGDFKSETSAGKNNAQVSVSDDSFIENNAKHLDEFQRIISNLDPNISVVENDELQECYSKILAMRPKLVKLLSLYQAKNEELYYASERFSKTMLTYNQLIHASASQPKPSYSNTQYGPNANQRYQQSSSSEYYPQNSQHHAPSSYYQPPQNSEHVSNSYGNPYKSQSQAIPPAANVQYQQPHYGQAPNQTRYQNMSHGAPNDQMQHHQSQEGPNKSYYQNQ